MKKQLALLVAVASLSALPAAAQAPAGSDEGWQFSLTPYLWLPGVDATLDFDVPPGAGGGPGVEVGSGDYLENLESVLMLSGEARKGSWAIFSDFIFMSFGDETSKIRSVSGPGGVVQVPIDADTTTSLDGMMWQLALSHAFSRSPANTFEVLGGFRYLTLETELDWRLAGPIDLFPQSGSFAQEEELLDAIVGVRGRLRLGGGNRWFAPWYLDAGAGDSKLTWQAMGGIGHGFKWGDVLFTYRHLSYEQGSDEQIQDLALSGAALGAAFHF